MDDFSVLNTHFDKIYALYINDNELTKIKYKMQLFNIQVEYFKGVDGKRELLSKFKQYTNSRKNVKHIKSIGIFGNLHSYIKLIKDAIQNKYKKILVFEPDVYFTKSFKSSIKLYLDMDYKILFLGASQNKWDNINIKEINTKNTIRYYTPLNTYGMFAIALDNSILNKLLTEMLKLRFPSDVCVSNLCNEYKNKSFVAYPNLIICDLSNSGTSGILKKQDQYMNTFKWAPLETNTYYIIDIHKVNFNHLGKYKMEIDVNSESDESYFYILDNNQSNIYQSTYLSQLKKENKIVKFNTGKIPINVYNIVLNIKITPINVIINNFFVNKIIFYKL